MSRLASGENWRWPTGAPSSASFENQTRPGCEVHAGSALPPSQVGATFCQRLRVSGAHETPAGSKPVPAPPQAAASLVGERCLKSVMVGSFLEAHVIELELEQRLGDFAFAGARVLRRLLLHRGQPIGRELRDRLFPLAIGGLPLRAGHVRATRELLGARLVLRARGTTGDACEGCRIDLIEHVRHKSKR